MDAGIIAAFKCHYHKHQLHHALDVLNAGKNLNKISQLKAMEWACEAWFNLKPSVLINCRRHTTLFSVTTPESTAINTAINEIDEEFTETYNQFFQAAGIQSAISINDFINPLEEKQSHELL